MNLVTCIELCSDSGLFIVARYSNPCRLSYSVFQGDKNLQQEELEGYHLDECTALCYVHTLCILLIAPLWCYSILRWQNLRTENWPHASYCVVSAAGRVLYPTLVYLLILLESDLCMAVFRRQIWKTFLSCFFSPLSSSNQVYFFSASFHSCVWFLCEVVLSVFYMVKQKLVLADLLSISNSLILI